MTDTEAAEVLAEFRKLKLGPELSAALDHAVGVLRAPKVILPPQFGTMHDSVAPSELTAAERIKAYGGIPMGIAQASVQAAA